MADGNNNTDSSTTTAATPKLTIPEFAAKLRQRMPELTPDKVDDATLVRKVLERQPEFTQYIETTEPRRRIRRGQESDAADQIQSIMGDRKFEDLSTSEQFHVLSLGFREYARRKAKKGAEETGLKKVLDYLQAAAGVQGDVSSQIVGAVSEPKNIAIGSTGMISPAIPSAYFFLEGATRLPGEARKVIQNPSYENILSSGLTATQVLGSGLETVEAGAEKFGKPTEKAAKKPGIMQRMGQRMVGTGPRVAEKLVRGEEREFAAAPEVVEGIKQKATESIQKINDKYVDDIAAIDAKYKDKVADREQAITKAEADYKSQIANIVEDYQKKVAIANHERTGESMMAAHRQKLATQSDGLSETVFNNVRNTHDVVKNSLDQRWDKLREDVGKERGVIAPPLYQSIEQSRGMLAGVPQDLTIFNQIIKEITERGSTGEAESHVLGEGAPDLEKATRVPKATIPFGDARVQFSALGEKAFGAEGNLRRALFNVYNAYDRALNDAAKAAGQAETYAALKADHAQFSRDWNDMSAMSTGGSPLARLYRAVDAPVITAIVNGKFYDRLAMQFNAYRRFGAATDVLGKLRDIDTELKGMPKPSHVAQPAAPRIPSPPTEPEPVPPPTEDIAKVTEKRNRDIKRIQTVAAAKTQKAMQAKTPEQMLQSLQEAKQDKTASSLENLSRLGQHEIVMTAIGLGAGAALLAPSGHAGYALIYLPVRFGVMAAASSPKVERLLGRVTPEDIDIINRMYERNPGMKVEGQQAITDLLIERARLGKEPVKLSLWQKFLSSEQMGKVLRAYMTGGRKTQEKPVPLELTAPVQSPMGVQAQQ